MANVVTSDSEFLELYRQALANHEQEIVNVLKSGVWGILLTKLKHSALTEREWVDVFKKHTDKVERARAIIAILREKDSLGSYIGFSRALCDSSRFDPNKVFPFISQLVKDGRHPPVQRNKKESRKRTVYVPTVPHDGPVVLWLVQTKHEYEQVPHLFKECVDDVQEEKFQDTNFLFKKLQMPVDLTPVSDECIPITLYLVRSDVPKPNYKDFFINFSPKPNFVIFSGVGSPIGTSCSHSDVIVVVRGEPTAACGEAEHVTVLSRLKKRKVQDSPSEKPKVNVVFGRATRNASHTNPDILVSSQEAVRFYNAIDDTSRVDNLAVVGLEHQGHSTNSSALCFSYELIQYFSKKLI